MSTTSRHAGYDNCKNIFIFFVVLLHFYNFNLLQWKHVTDDWSPVMTNLVHSYYEWHEKMSVPGFVFVSGFFGKGFLPSEPTGPKTDVRWEKTISVLLIGSALLQVTYFVSGCVLTRVLTGTWVEIPLWFPLFDQLETWYLVALALWRMGTPLIGRLKYPIASSFLLAFVCLHVQLEEPRDMRQRVIHFLPYYVIGLYCQEKHLDVFRYPRTVGVLGMLLTYWICVQVDPKYLGHVYRVASWELLPHVVFFLQYILCGMEVLSVMLLMRSIKQPLFPFGHSNSTLAIYEWHWPIVGMIAWGQIPFTQSPLPYFADPSILVSMAKHCHPWVSLLVAHVLSYFICIALGSKAFWQWVRPISDPNCSILFASSSCVNGMNDGEMKRRKCKDAELGYFINNKSVDLEGASQ